MDSSKAPEVVRVARAKRKEKMERGREFGGLVLTFRLGDWVDVDNGRVLIQVTKSDHRSGRNEIRLRFISDRHVKISRSEGPQE